MMWGFMTDDTLAPAGFWRRLWAKCLDISILFFPAAFFFIFMKLHFVCLILFIIGGWSYVGKLTAKRQATSGKGMAGVYVVRADNGQIITKHQALARYLLVYLPLMIFILTNATIIDLASEKNRGKHTEQEKQAIEELYNAEQQAPETLLQMIINDSIIGYYLLMACMVAITKQKRGFHDKLCNTRVIRGKLAKSI